MKFFNEFSINHLANKKISKNFSDFFCKSSSILKESASGLDISSSLRSSFVFLIKSLSRYPSNKFFFINIVPGPFKTKRLKKLVKNIREYKKKLSSGKIGDPAEIGKFIRFIVENKTKYIVESKTKYINGSTIYFDGNINNSFI
jgi:hypothetical protein